MLPIAIDVMSGDSPPRESLAGALPALISAALEPLPAAVRERAALVAATQVVTMEEKPREAIRRKKDSSMRLAVDQVHAGRASACVSAGNTGALTAIAHFVLKTLPGVERAAIISAIPAAHGHTHMLDLGANTKATPGQLRQFADMGAIVARDVYGVASPRIGLLNIGEEDMKGHEVVQAAHALLGASGLNYVGFVEGDDIFSGDVDVVARPVLRRAAAGLDPRRYNGACMVGLSGIVVKSHGRADGVAFARAIGTAALAARRGLTSHIAQALQVEGAVI